jgi:hypothetical protein
MTTFDGNGEHSICSMAASYYTTFDGNGESSITILRLMATVNAPFLARQLQYYYHVQLLLTYY